MVDSFPIQTLVLLLITVAVFASLQRRFRTRRTVLWLLAWCAAALRMALLTETMNQGAWQAAGNAVFMLTAILFMGSLSQLTKGSKALNFYLIPFAIPLVLYSAVYPFFPHPGTLIRLGFMALGLLTLVPALVWCLHDHLLDNRFSLPFCAATGALFLYSVYRGDYGMAMLYVHGAMSLMTALMLLFTYRKLTSGVFLAAGGFFVWSMTPLYLMPGVVDNPKRVIFLGAVINLSKIVAAIGMLVLILEEELERNMDATARDHRARMELERYSQLDVVLDPGLEMADVYDHLCSVVASASRFRNVVLFLRTLEENYYVAGHAGLDAQLGVALDALAHRVTPVLLRGYSRAHGVVELGNTRVIDLRPLFTPNDPLEKLGFHTAYAVPMRDRAGALDGALLLSGMKTPAETLMADDLLPIELLVSRLTAAREHSMMTRKLVRSEKLAGLGQLAGGVAHELNNPLTVVMGYSGLMEEYLEDPEMRRQAGVIHSESLRMKTIIEALGRFWRPFPGDFILLNLGELIQDISRLHTSEFLINDIDFRLSVAKDLPLVHGNGDQMKQLLLQLLHNAVEAIERSGDSDERVLRVEATRVDDHVHIVVADSGPGFPDPERVFDPFFTTKEPGEGPGLGLSLCYAIIHEHNGEIRAINLHPEGAAIVVDLPAATRSEVEATQL